MIKKGTVLIIEDNHDSLKLITEVLLNDGYSVRPADSGELALAAIPVVSPDLILLDIRLPGMTGFEVLKHIKIMSGDSLPVIILSSVDEPEQVVQALKLGAVDFIKKPFQREELLSRINIHMELYRTRISLEALISQKNKYVDDLKNSEEKLKASNKQLSESYHQLRQATLYLDNLIDYANAPIIIWDSEFLITRFNRAFEILTGMDAEAVIGKPVGILFPEDKVAVYMQLIETAILGEKWDFVEIEVRNVNGAARTVLWNSATLFSADEKKPIATIAQGQDITELKLIQIEKQKVQEKLTQSQKLQAIGVLAAGVAHEINNPMTIILGHSQLLLKKLRAEDESVKPLQAIVKSTIRCKALIGNLLIFSRSSNNIKNAVSIVNIIKDAVRLVEVRAKVNNIEIIDGYEENMPHIIADANQIQQILINGIIFRFCHKATEELYTSSGSSVSNFTTFTTVLHS